MSRAWDSTDWPCLGVSGDKRRSVLTHRGVMIIISISERSLRKSPRNHRRLKTAGSYGGEEMIFKATAISGACMNVFQQMPEREFSIIGPIGPTSFAR